MPLVKVPDAGAIVKPVAETVEAICVDCLAVKYAETVSAMQYLVRAKNGDDNSRLICVFWLLCIVPIGMLVELVA